MDYGIISLVPPLAMLTFAAVTKKSFESLMFGSFVAFILLYGWDFLTPWCDMLLEEISNPDNAYILMVCGLFGGLIFLLKEARGTLGFSRLVAKVCKSERMVLMASVIMGCIIFVDDYLNIMTIGTCMNKVCDERKIPRESLAYVIDSTGAPVCALLPFSTWAVFYSGIFYQEEAIVDMGFGSGLNTYIQAIPYMFYPICALIVVVLFSLGIMPKLGAMKKAYERAQNEVRTAVAEHGDEPLNPGDPLDFLLPIGILIGVTVFTGDMLIAIVTTLLVCMVFYLARKRMNFDRFMQLFFDGFADMIPVLGILLASFLVRNSCARLNLSEYVISLVAPYLNGQILPAIVFLIVAVLTFVTVSFWGIEAVALTIVVPLGVTLGSNLLLLLAAIVSGGVFGSHACFYADATVLSSATCEINNLDHAVTQIPYAVIGAIMATILYLVAGFVLV